MLIRNSIPLLLVFLIAAPFVILETVESYAQGQNVDNPVANELGYALTPLDLLVETPEMDYSNGVLNNPAEIQGLRDAPERLRVDLIQAHTSK